MRRTPGFTLIELMVAVAIIAILAAIAIPSYSDYVRRVRVAEALSAMSAMGVKMEQYYHDNLNYLGACVQSPPGPVTIANLPQNTVNWAYTCNPVAANNYTMQATGQPGSTMAGFQYTVDQAGNRATIMVAPSTWLGNAGCWVLKKDGSC